MFPGHRSTVLPIVKLTDTRILLLKACTWILDYYINFRSHQLKDDERRRLLLLLQLRSTARRTLAGIVTSTNSHPEKVKSCVYAVILQEVTQQQWATAWPLQQQQQQHYAAGYSRSTGSMYSASPPSPTGQSSSYSQMRSQQQYHSSVPSSSARGYQQRRYITRCFRSEL